MCAADTQGSLLSFYSPLSFFLLHPLPPLPHPLPLAFLSFVVVPDDVREEIRKVREQLLHLHCCRHKHQYDDDDEDEDGDDEDEDEDEDEDDMQGVKEWAARIISLLCAWICSLQRVTNGGIRPICLPSEAASLLLCKLVGSTRQNGSRFVSYWRESQKEWTRLSWSIHHFSTLVTAFLATCLICISNEVFSSFSRNSIGWTRQVAKELVSSWRESQKKVDHFAYQHCPLKQHVSQCVLSWKESRWDQFSPSSSFLLLLGHFAFSLSLFFLFISPFRFGRPIAWSHDDADGTAGHTQIFHVSQEAWAVVGEWGVAGKRECTAKENCQEICGREIETLKIGGAKGELITQREKEYWLQRKTGWIPVCHEINRKLWLCP